ncbi:MAG: hypothetical protein COA57_03290 [Flavobacteriales bacterium]|nr:MAG: hypothetical protein COA57_03290 [Flavobacteriales bacterium]
MAKFNAYRMAGHLAFIILLTYSAYFFLERTIFIDSACQIFNLIQAKTFQVYAGRYGVVFSELIPLVAVHSGLQLKTILFVISIAPVLLYYFVFLLCSYFLKSDAAGLCIPLILILCVRDSFYLIGTEATQGLVYIMLFFAWLYWKKRKNNMWHSIITLLLILLCVITHPVTLIPLFFVACYYAIEQGWTNWKNLVIPCTIAVLSILKLIIGHTTSHDGMHLSKVNADNAIQAIPDFFQMFAVNFFIRHTFIESNRYLLWLILVVITACVLIYQRKYLKFTWMTCGIFVFFFISNMVYKDGEAGIMMDKALAPLSIFVGVPLMVEVLNEKYKKSYVVLFVLVVIVFLRIRDISLTGKTYTKRLAYIERVLDYTKQFPERKFVIERKNISEKHIKVPWAFAFETLLFSSIQNPDSSRTVYIVDDINAFETNSQNKNLFLAAPFWRDMRIDDLNLTYFNLPKEKYRIIGEKIQ